jgi:hypothetical protein
VVLAVAVSSDLDPASKGVARRRNPSRRRAIWAGPLAWRPSRSGGPLASAGCPLQDVKLARARWDLLQSRPSVLLHCLAERPRSGLSGRGRFVSSWIAWRATAPRRVRPWRAAYVVGPEYESYQPSYHAASNLLKRQARYGSKPRGRRRVQPGDRAHRWAGDAQTRPALSSTVSSFAWTV